MARRGTVTFLGPVMSNGGALKGPSLFYMLQPNNQGAAVRLAYPTRNEALAARKTLAQGDQTFTVDSAKLFEAIQYALESQLDASPVDPGQPQTDG